VEKLIALAAAPAAPPKNNVKITMKKPARLSGFRR
jgi:hypothetical protein